MSFKKALAYKCLFDIIIQVKIEMEWENMKLISWNVNGLRANITKGFEKFFKEVDADIFAYKKRKCKKNR